ncbi:MAG TPA: ATP-binding protein, partial [Bacteroidia bacterium]|nr:ATP-binding protein [Bacteroidia bacterium]
MKQYQDYTNTNKNALALEVLQRYAIQQEVALNKERDSVAKALQNEFIQSQKKRSEEISGKENQIIELKSGNEDIDRENIKMTRNTLLFFGILIGIAVLVLLNRFRSLASIKEQFELSNSYVRYTEKFAEDPQKDRSEASRLSHAFQNAQRHIEEASVYLNNIVADKQNPLNKSAALLLANTNKSNLLLQPEKSLEEGTKQSTDLNQLIDEVTDQAYFYFGSEAPEFNCDVVRDLEKILPKIDIIAEEIRLVVFNLLMNAFDSVNEKRKNAPKGYIPKVTISTRKLPRFVQIRIKDNGTGIREKEPKQLLEPFYSTKKSEKNP